MEKILVINHAITSPLRICKHNNNNNNKNKKKSNRTGSCAISCLCLKEQNQSPEPANNNTTNTTSTTNNDTWHLFNEAQHNILQLNNQRIAALQELDRLKAEKQSLLDRISHLESHILPQTDDRQSLCWELLLRIDAMVLNGMIDVTEAFALRKAVSGFRVACLVADIVQKGDAEVLADLRHLCLSRKINRFHVIHICTEMEPLVSVGPLGPYVTGLSQALQREGHLVEVILPKYSCMDLTGIHGLREIEAEAYSYFNGQLHGNRIWTGVVRGIGVTLIQPLSYSSFFGRERVYGYSDDFEWFTYFSRASLDYIVRSGKQPDVLHIHNWETALVGPLFWDIFVKQGLEGSRILLSCQSFDSQCLEQPEKLALCGLDPARLHRPDRLQDNAKGHLVNLLKGGVVYSNKVLIVSPMHSKEWIIRNLGHGLEPTLALYKEKLIITPYGFDSHTWDPSSDKFLPENYSADDLNGKAVCKDALQHRLDLSRDPSIILVGCAIAELADFDPDILRQVVWSATAECVQFIFIGEKATGINRALESLQEEIKDGTVKFVTKYDEALEHLIFAGSDIILCQSFHDPLLQVPLKALKYGAAPISVAANETRFRYIVDEDQATTRYLQFINSTFGNKSLIQALHEIRNRPLIWEQKIKEAMTKDFSWDADCCDIHVSAYEYVKLL